MSEKDVDLAPHEWRSERPKEKQPFFGKGAVDALLYFVGFCVVYGAVRYFTGG